MTIREQFLYGLVKIETSPWTTSLVWTDRTADLVGGFNYSQGGRVGTPGTSQVDVGTLNATFKNLASVPAVGALIRVSFTGAAGYAFVGYVQDVSQRIVFDSSVSYNTPVTLTTLNCADWVGYVSQFQAIGVGGLSSLFAPQDNYTVGSRVRALNNIIDPSNATQMITDTASGATSIIGDTDMVGTFSDHLDLVSATDNRYWYAENVLPTNPTTGRTGLIRIRQLSGAPSSGKTFTDLAGSAGQLHYTEINLESSSQNVANTIVLNNSSVITATSAAPLFVPALISQIGGGNRPNYSIVNGVEFVSVPYEQTWSGSDASSITTYGNRATEINTNLAGLVQAANLASNPSAEYSDTGYSAGASVIVRRRKPADVDASLVAYSGEWSIRCRQNSAASTGTVQFNGAETDGTPIIPGNVYYAQARAARGTPARSDARARIIIRWLDDSEAIVSSSTGAQVNMVTGATWYQVTVSGTAPAGASRARVNVEFSRSGGANIPSGDVHWMDALQLSEQNTTYFDGDTAADNSFVYLWTGEVGLSPSFRITNNLDDTITTYLSRFSTTSNRVTRIRWNAQEDLTAVPSMYVGSTISIIYDGTTTTYRIVGINGNVDPSRYMIDYYLEKV